MAKYTVTAKGVATTTVARTIVQVLAPAGARIKLKGWRISFSGTSAAAVPGDVDILRQTTAGTATALTPAKTDEADEAARSTAAMAHTAEPTAGDVLESAKVTPNGGIWAEPACNDGDGYAVAGGGRIAVRTTYAADVTVTVTLWVEE